ncbi:hypothetical protein DCC78_10715 [bacterium]|nr:MAG: hypothetical protein DCC78_10715 [bacterium]
MKRGPALTGFGSTRVESLALVAKDGVAAENQLALFEARELDCLVALFLGLAGEPGVGAGVLELELERLRELLRGAAGRLRPGCFVEPNDVGVEGAQFLDDNLQPLVEGVRGNRIVGIARKRAEQIDEGDLQLRGGFDRFGQGGAAGSGARAGRGRGGRRPIVGRAVDGAGRGGRSHDDRNEGGNQGCSHAREHATSSLAC